MEIVNCGACAGSARQVPGALLGQISLKEGFPATEPGPTIPPSRSVVENDFSRLSVRAIFVSRTELKLTAVWDLVTSCDLRNSHGETGAESCQSPLFSSRASCSQRAYISRSAGLNVYSSEWSYHAAPSRSICDPISVPLRKTRASRYPSARCVYSTTTF